MHVCAPATMPLYSPPTVVHARAGGALLSCMLATRACADADLAARRQRQRVDKGVRQHRLAPLCPHAHAGGGVDGVTKESEARRRSTNNTRSCQKTTRACRRFTRLPQALRAIAVPRRQAHDCSYPQGKRGRQIGDMDARAVQGECTQRQTAVQAWGRCSGL